MTVGGVDTYYDYDEKQWKSRKLGGGPIRHTPPPAAALADDPGSVQETTSGEPTRTSQHPPNISAH